MSDAVKEPGNKGYSEEALNRWLRRIGLAQYAGPGRALEPPAEPPAPEDAHRDERPET